MLTNQSFVSTEVRTPHWSTQNMRSKGSRAQVGGESKSNIYWELPTLKLNKSTMEMSPCLIIPKSNYQKIIFPSNTNETRIG